MINYLCSLIFSIGLMPTLALARPQQKPIDQRLLLTNTVEVLLQEIGATEQRFADVLAEHRSLSAAMAARVKQQHIKLINGLGSGTTCQEAVAGRFGKIKYHEADRLQAATADLICDSSRFKNSMGKEVTLRTWNFPKVCAHVLATKAASNPEELQKCELDLRNLQALSIEETSLMDHLEWLKLQLPRKQLELESLPAARSE